jgi:glycosyltransferase involved in cell wall biosynthesis
MKILHVCPTFTPDSIGGAEESVRLLAVAQKEWGQDVKVHVLAPSPRLSSAPENVEMDGVTVHRVPNPYRFWFPDWKKSSPLVRRIAKVEEVLRPGRYKDMKSVIEQVKPDILNTHSMVSLSPAIWRWGQACGAAVVHTLRDYDFLCIRSNLTKGGRQCAGHCNTCKIYCASKRVVGERYIDAVVGIGRDVLDTHFRYGLFGGISRNRTRIIWNSEAPSNDAWGPVKNLSRQSALRVGYLGRYSAEKGVSTLLAALQTVAKSVDLVLNCAGFSEADLNAEDRATIEAIPKKNFLGWVKPAEFLRDAVDVLIVPSLYPEPFGRVVLDAMRFGVPVICTNNGGPAEIMGEELAPWMFSPGSTDQLIKLLSGFSDGNYDYKNYDARRNFVRDSVSDRLVSDKYLSLYRDLSNK